MNWSKRLWLKSAVTHAHKYKLIFFAVDRWRKQHKHRHVHTRTLTHTQLKRLSYLVYCWTLCTEREGWIKDWKAFASWQSYSLEREKFTNYLQRFLGLHDSCGQKKGRGLCVTSLWHHIAQFLVNFLFFFLLWQRVSYIMQIWLICRYKASVGF